MAKKQTKTREKLWISEKVAAFRNVLKVGEPDSDVVHQAREMLDGIETGVREIGGSTIKFRFSGLTGSRG